MLLKNCKIYSYIFLICLITSPLHAEKIYAEFDKVLFNDKLTKVITVWNSDDGIKIFETAKYKKDFYHLAHHYQPQSNPLYCGIATSAIILNALNLDDNIISNSINSVINPIKNNSINFNIYTQNDILNKSTDLVKKRKIISFKTKNSDNHYDPGLSLQQLSDILQTHNLNTKIFYANDDSNKGIKEFEKILKNSLNKKDEYIIANFHGKTLGAKTSGHISPIVSYNEKTDDILILDVAAHKNPWYWVKVIPFYKAMQKKDGDRNRGFLLVSKDTKS